VTLSISVLVLTRNEEINIAACLESLSWCDDVVVFDSLSTDRTQALAAAHGARVVTRTFDNCRLTRTGPSPTSYSGIPGALSRRGRALPGGPARRRATPRGPMHRKPAFASGARIFSWALAEACAALPTWLVRLFRRRIRYERLVNPCRCRRPIGQIDAHILHYPFSHGVSHWVARHNRYSDMEAIEAAKVREGAPPGARSGRGIE